MPIVLISCLFPAYYAYILTKSCVYAAYILHIYSDSLTLLLIHPPVIADSSPSLLLPLPLIDDLDASLSSDAECGPHFPIGGWPFFRFAGSISIFCLWIRLGRIQGETIGITTAIRRVSAQTDVKLTPK